MRRHNNAVIVQDDFTKWIQSYPMKTRDTSETMSFSQRSLPPWQKPDIIYTHGTDSSQEHSEACQDSQWNHDTSTPHRSETNGVAERAVRRVKEGTAVAVVQSGPPEEWWDCAMEYCCYLRNVHDKMSDDLTEYIPTSAKDKSRVHQIGKKTLKGIFLGVVPRAERGKSGDFTRDEWNHRCVCATLAISALSPALKRCRKEHKKMEVKKESQHNVIRWRI